MATYQFKRILNSEKSLEETIIALNTKLDPPLLNGEPLLCSYKEGDIKRFIIAVGTNEGVYITPSFRNQQDIDDFIKNRTTGINLADQISTESDFIITKDSEGKLKFNIKDNLKNI
jgi:hypothetical protein